MRVGIYDPYLDDLGGGEKYMMSIAECLSKDHDVSVFWDDKKDLDELLGRFSIDLSKVKIEKNIFSKNTSLIERLLKTKKYDVMIFLSDGSIPLIASKKLFIHVQQPLKLEEKSFTTKIKQARVSGMFCNSEFTRSFIPKNVSFPVKIIYPPVNLYPVNIKRENIILHVGRFRVRNIDKVDYKKQAVMVRAFKEMVDEGLKGWRFVMAVSVKKNKLPDFEVLRSEAREYPIEFQINQSNHNLWKIYSKARIYWHASGFGEDLEEHPEFAEHFGISTVEAMGAGAVPIVINAGGQKEIVEDEKSGYLWDSLKEFKDKTSQIISDGKKMSEMSKNAAKRAKIFSSQKFCERISEMILTS